MIFSYLSIKAWQPTFIEVKVSCIIKLADLSPQYQFKHLFFLEDFLLRSPTTIFHVVKWISYQSSSPSLNKSHLYSHIDAQLMLLQTVPASCVLGSSWADWKRIFAQTKYVPVNLCKVFYNAIYLFGPFRLVLVFTLL